MNDPEAASGPSIADGTSERGAQETGDVAAPHSGKKAELPWYYQTSFIIFMLLSLPPLALPSIIGHPRISGWNKFLYTLAILMVSWGLWIAIVFIYRTILQLIQIFHDHQL